MAEVLIDEATRLTRLASAAEKRLRNRLYDAILFAKEDGSLAEIAALIEAGRFDEVLELAAANVSARLAEEVAVVYAASGAATGDAIRDSLNVSIGFNQVNNRAVRFLQEERFRLVEGFTAEQRRATRDAMADGTARGLNPVDQARAFRDSIGLTQKQQAAVVNFRRLLEGGSSEALSRQLRDKRFDATIRRAQSSGEPLTSEQIDRMVSRYAARYVKYRSEVIGRTEALRAVRAADDEMYQQAVETGIIQAESLQRDLDYSL